MSLGGREIALRTRILYTVRIQNYSHCIDIDIDLKTISQRIYKHEIYLKARQRSGKRTH